ncbi:MAG: PIN domain protein [Spirochaetia bacterium]
MKTLSVYLDTSVLGGCFDPEFQIWSNGLFQDFSDGELIPVVSSLVVLEIQLAPLKVQNKLREILDQKHIFLEPSIDSQELAEIYIYRGIVSRKYADDALHIALATVNTIDIMVSWNFKHIVHYDKIRKVNAVNSEYGY